MNATVLEGQACAPNGAPDWQPKRCNSVSTAEAR